MVLEFNKWRKGGVVIKIKQKGVGLIEVMVSVLILSFGVLGVSTLMAVNLKNTQSSMERTQAIIQSNAILDIMRANKADAIIGKYNLTGWTCNAPASDNAYGSQLATWMGDLKSGLGSTACAKLVCNTASCEVQIRWDDSRGTGGKDNSSFSVVTRL